MTTNRDTLDINFEGYFMCRLTTDPDPTDERRGVSGYTLALANEDDLDNWLQLNPSPEYIQKNLREPGKSLIEKKSLALGVTVTSATVKGADYPQAQALVGGKVNLLGDDRIERPMFEGRNDIVGSDDNVEFPIDPFIIDIKSLSQPAIHISRKDVLPDDQPIWKLPPSAYQDRVGRQPSQPEPILEVMEAIGVYDFFEYFRDRARYISRLMERSTEPAEIEMYKTRLYAIDFFGDRIRTRLGMQRLWNFNIEGSAGIAEGLPEIDVHAPWPINFWLGGFDGDLLIGYMRGTLHLPFA